jgi:hypothetical protein
VSTKQEIIKQIKRLERYGKLNDVEVDDYIEALQKFSNEQLSRGFKYLANNYTGFGFPKLPEISRAITDSKQDDEHVFDHTGDEQITSAFMGAFAVIWQLEKENFARYNAKLRDINDHYGDAVGEQKKRCIDEMQALKAEVLLLPRKSFNSNGMPKAISGRYQVPVQADTNELQKVAVEIADSDLPF